MSYSRTLCGQRFRNCELSYCLCSQRKGIKLELFNLFCRKQLVEAIFLVASLNGQSAYTQVNKLFGKRNERPLAVIELTFVSGVLSFVDMDMAMKYFVWLRVLMGRCWPLRVRYQTFINSIRLNGNK